MGIEKMTLPNLTYDTQEQVFSFLNKKDLSNVRLTSELMRSVSDSDVIWRRFVNETFPHVNKKKQDESWRELYARLDMRRKQLANDVEQLTENIKERGEHAPSYSEIPGISFGLKDVKDLTILRLPGVDYDTILELDKFYQEHVDDFDVVGTIDYYSDIQEYFLSLESLYQNELDTEHTHSWIISEESVRRLLFKLLDNNIPWSWSVD